MTLELLRNQGALSRALLRACPAELGAAARRAGFDLDVNPFWVAHERVEAREWNDAWMREHIREERREHAEEAQGRA